MLENRNSKIFKDFDREMQCGGLLSLRLIYAQYCSVVGSGEQRSIHTAYISSSIWSFVFNFNYHLCQNLVLTHIRTHAYSSQVKGTQEANNFDNYG